MPERYKSPFPPPDARQREVVEIIIEECAEVQHCACKLLRFGPLDAQPGQPHDNAYRLGLEIGDLFEVINVAVNEGLIPVAAIQAGKKNKRRQLARFMQTEPPKEKKIWPFQGHRTVAEVMADAGEN